MSSSTVISSPASAPAIPYKIAVLVFLENAAGDHLLLLRAKPPNLGSWSPIGGKLETATGESPFECAVRETAERAQEPCIGADRADLVLAGAAILQAVQELWPCSRVRVADRGLREGLLMSLMSDQQKRPRRRRRGGASKKPEAA